MTELPERIWVGDFYFGQVSHQEPLDPSIISKEYLSADTAIPRAAFERAMQEAVEAERERCAAMVDAKGQQWWQRTSGDDFTATDMADLAAAIRASQEPTE